MQLQQGGETKTFQMEGLADWRDVAYKTLRTVGWQMSCTYEDTIFPEATQQTRIQWDKITVTQEGTEKGEELEKQSERRKAAQMEIQSMAEVTNGMAKATILIWKSGILQKGKVIIMGKVLKETSALMEGMAFLLGILVAEKELEGIIEGNEKEKIEMELVTKI